MCLFVYLFVCNLLNNSVPLFSLLSLLTLLLLFVCLFVCLFLVQDSYGDSALHDAIAKDFGEIVKLLVNAAGIDFSLKNRRGFNVLHLCALKGNGM